MDKEGQNPASAVFKSEDIGNKATPEYFSNIKGGRQDQTKVQEKRTRSTRKTLFIILGVVAAVLIIITLVFVTLSILNRRGTYGERTGEDIPTAIEEIEERAYTIAFKDLENPGDFESALYYINNLIADMIDTNQDSTLIYATKAFRTILAYQAGGQNIAIEYALALEEDATTDAEKYIIYGTLDRLYIWQGDMAKATEYENKRGVLDTEENRNGYFTGFDDEGSIESDQRGEETENIDYEETIDSDEGVE